MHFVTMWLGNASETRLLQWVRNLHSFQTTPHHILHSLYDNNYCRQKGPMVLHPYLDKTRHCRVKCFPRARCKLNSDHSVQNLTNTRLFVTGHFAENQFADTRVDSWTL